MINVATVGYKRYNYSKKGEDIIKNFIPDLLSMSEGFSLCFTDIVEDRKGEPINKLVDKMIESGADVVHYVNYRDPYNGENVDQQYIEEVGRRNPKLPVLLTSAHLDAEEFAKKLNIAYLNVPFGVKEYKNTLKELVNK